MMARLSILVPNLTFRAAGLFLTVFALWNVVNPLDPLIERPLFVGLLILIVFLQSLMNAGRSVLLRWLDFVLILATVDIMSIARGSGWILAPVCAATTSAFEFAAELIRLSLELIRLSLFRAGADYWGSCAISWSDC